MFVLEKIKWWTCESVSNLYEILKYFELKKLIYRSIGPPLVAKIDGFEGHQSIPLIGPLYKCEN